MGAGASIEESQKVLFIKELKEIMQDESKPPEQLICNASHHFQELINIKPGNIVDAGGNPGDNTAEGNLGKVTGQGGETAPKIKEKHKSAKLIHQNLTKS